ncbi:hypothetical protein PHYSODRAFT_558115 [Phytophthora sojae]|uniref:Core-binding (CB) domain-containing protein n=1 Tax=Phytophthora sojae (strain P6497) TaxID=1094619 RepID=G4Z2X8_PHYSP|nr:hypothetical protein PHYSODRAFT_558115 [Phytophthora sojae]EGZ19311.1 hypothetical protein PHYSODRAFT_558115 [Phytophthora sojae]|eukprot:XP_009522028.1 hypothetical protein PHYSODRAFT_558115 [Phytophthora sojae]
MEGHDWEKLERTVREIRDNTVTARSRATYQNSYCRFLAWLVRNKPHLAPQPFLEALATRLDTVQDIISELEKRAIGAGAVTYDGLNDAIRACLRDTGVAGLVEKLASAQEPVVEASGAEAERQMCHFWGGKFRRVPADFGIPDCSVRHAWVLWMSSSAFSCASKNLLQLGQSIDAATQVFLACADSVTVDDITEHSRKRRRGQLSWATVGKLLRKKSKKNSQLMMIHSNENNHDALMRTTLFAFDITNCSLLLSSCIASLIAE